MCIRDSTSIIGYLDLLEKQDLPAEAADYVKILRRKSERLSHTVNDLFTLSKATSGEESVVLEPLDLVMAVHQTLADMGDCLLYTSRSPASPAPGPSPSAAGMPRGRTSRTPLQLRPHRRLLPACS